MKVLFIDRSKSDRAETYYMLTQEEYEAKRKELEQTDDERLAVYYNRQIRKQPTTTVSDGFACCGGHHFETNDGIEVITNGVFMTTIKYYFTEDMITVNEYIKTTCWWV